MQINIDRQKLIMTVLHCIKRRLLLDFKSSVLLARSEICAFDKPFSTFGNISFTFRFLLWAATRALLCTSLFTELQRYVPLIHISAYILHRLLVNIFSVRKNSFRNFIVTDRATLLKPPFVQRKLMMVPACKSSSSEELLKRHFIVFLFYFSFSGESW